MKTPRDYRKSRPGDLDASLKAVEATLRINARLDRESAMKVDYLTQTTGGNLTSVVKEAIGHYYTEVRRSQVSPADILLEEGFVGCSDGEPDLSSRYKDQLSTSLATKYDLG